MPTSVSEDTLCLNGMSFSQRQSPFANSALVVSVSPEDLGSTHNPLLGVEWQLEIERRAAVMGGGRLVAPVQRVTDFLAERPTPMDGHSISTDAYRSPYSSHQSTSAVPSSYRLGVRGAACHSLYPDYITGTLQQALLKFDRQMPGFITPGEHMFILLILLNSVDWF